MVRLKLPAKIVAAPGLLRDSYTAPSRLVGSAIDRSWSILVSPILRENCLCLLPRLRSRSSLTKTFYVAAVCDILDSLVIATRPCITVRPLLPDRKNCGFVGRARTVRWMETDYIREMTLTESRSKPWTPSSPGRGCAFYRAAGTNAPWGD